MSFSSERERTSLSLFYCQSFVTNEGENHNFPSVHFLKESRDPSHALRYSENLFKGKEDAWDYFWQFPLSGWRREYFDAHVTDAHTHFCVTAKRRKNPAISLWVSVRPTLACSVSCEFMGHFFFLFSFSLRAFGRSSERDWRLFSHEGAIS